MPTSEIQMRMEQWTRAQFTASAIRPSRESEAPQTRYVAMQDGIRLKTIITLPVRLTGGEQFPTILVRSCYPQQDALLRTRAEEFAKRGFCFVYQWCRGTGGSEGVWEPNIHERSDGLDTLAWLSSQAYVRNIGYWGDSYLALTGWCMADAVPEKVKTMVLGVYGVDRYTSAYQDGLFRMDVLTSWAKENAGLEITVSNDASYKFRPQMEVDEVLWGTHLSWYRDWVRNPECSDYWRKGFWGMLREIPKKVRIPLFIREGWYDHHLGSALVSYKDLPEEIRQHSLLQIGPWNHAYQPVIPEEHVSVADDSMTAPLQWFHRILVENDLPDGQIQEYIIGANKWSIQKELAQPLYKPFYLHDQKLLEAVPEIDSVRTYCYDPEVPVQSHGCESLLSSMRENGSFLQPLPNYRDDVLSFISNELDEPLLLDGEIMVKLYVSSDAEDTAFSAKVMEVLPDGRTVNVRGSITSLAFRNGDEKIASYQPGTPVMVTIHMWRIAWCFRKGSKIRLDISSSDYPQYTIHSNYAGLWSLQKETKKARQCVHMGLRHPSVVLLPISN